METHARTHTHTLVLSKSVHDAFAYLKNPNTKETERFMLMFDDCMNVQSMDELDKRRNPDLKPYHSSQDPRSEVNT